MKLTGALLFVAGVVLAVWGFGSWILFAGVFTAVAGAGMYIFSAVSTGAADHPHITE